MNANMLQVTTPQSRLPELIAAAGERASMRFLEFFAANIRNPHTRRAYYRAAEEFLAWCASVGVSKSIRGHDMRAYELSHTETTGLLSHNRCQDVKCGWLYPLAKSTM